MPPYASNAPALLSAGDYWASGNKSDAPYVGNSWTATTLLSDGSPGDTTTRVTAVGDPADTITILTVRSSINITSWPVTLKFNGTLLISEYSYWSGLVWVVMAETSELDWSPHGSYVDESFTETFSGQPAATIFRAVFQTNSVVGGDMSASDSRPA